MMEMRPVNPRGRRAIRLDQLRGTKCKLLQLPPLPSSTRFSEILCLLTSRFEAFLSKLDI
jgi:hypothetical protein